MKRFIHHLSSMIYHLRAFVDPAAEGNPFVADREYEFKTDERKVFFSRRRWALR